MSEAYSPIYMRRTKSDDSNKMRKERRNCNKVFSIVALVCVLLFSSFTEVWAVMPTEQSREKHQAKASQPLISNTTDKDLKIEKPRLLFAESTPIQREIEIIDSLVFIQELEEEDEYSIPAEDLYQSWNNQYVNPYKGIAMPDSFAIDLTSVIMPINDENIRITSKYGPRKRRMHRGIDLKVQVGDTIRAVCDGKVRVKRFEKRGYGYFLVLRHDNGLETVYGHLSKFLVEEDEQVKAGQPIALGGNTGRSTGSHLHFETRFFGEAIDPALMFDFENKVMHVDTYVFNKKAVNKYTGNGGAKITYHRIKKGDTLATIARKYGLTVSQLCKLNGITPRTTIRAGRSLRLS